MSRPPTYADIEALPENLVGEIIDGELIVSPRPAPAHARGTSDLAGLLGPPFRFGRGGPGGWWILFEPELHLGSDVVVPDLGGWRRERMPSLPQTAWFELAPDWVCEVLSASTARVDRGRKLALYRRHQVSHVWLLDPVAHTLEVFRLSDAGLVLVDVLAEGAKARIEPFEAIDLELDLLWGSPDGGASPPAAP
jgi:Uma2 family endonuclease